jgi:hypothetical protein
VNYSSAEDFYSAIFASRSAQELAASMVAAAKQVGLSLLYGEYVCAHVQTSNKQRFVERGLRQVLFYPMIVVKEAGKRQRRR